MISKEVAKKMLNSGERQYSDEEFVQILELLYKLANIEYDLFKDMMITINKKFRLKNGKR